MLLRGSGFLYRPVGSPLLVIITLFASESVWALIVRKPTGTRGGVIKASSPQSRFLARRCAAIAVAAADVSLTTTEFPLRIYIYLSSYLSSAPAEAETQSKPKKTGECWNTGGIERRKERRRETRERQACYFAEITWNSRSHRCVGGEIYVVRKTHLPARTCVRARSTLHPLPDF